jgi:hypothetical protein
MNPGGKRGGKSRGPAGKRITGGFARSGTIAADSGTRYLRGAIRKDPNAAFNERLVAATGRMTPSMANFSNGRTGDFYRPGSGNKFNGSARMAKGTGTGANPAKPGDRVTVTERNSDRQYAGRKYTYKVADSAGPRLAYSKTNRGLAKRLLKGG